MSFCIECVRPVTMLSACHAAAALLGVQRPSGSIREGVSWSLVPLHEGLQAPHLIELPGTWILHTIGSLLATRYLGFIQA